MFYSFTYFRVSAWWLLPLFQWHAFFSAMQLRRIEGLNTFQTWAQKGLVFCTLTGWDSRSHMLKFRNRGAHLKAMKIHKKLGVAYSVSWEADIEPTPDECRQKLIESGVLPEGLVNLMS